MKKKVLFFIPLFLSVLINVHSQDPQFLHFDLTVATGIPFFWGSETEKLYIGSSLMPEFRIRLLPGNEPLNIFCAIGYSGVSTLFNPSENEDSSDIITTPFSDLPIYFSTGIVFNVSSQSQGQMTNNVSSGITNIFFGFGYMNTIIGNDSEGNDIYDAGPFFYLGLSTNALSFAFY